MTRPIEVLTPLERNQMMERLMWEQQKKGIPIVIPIDSVTGFIYHGETVSKAIQNISKLTQKESDELDNCVSNA